MKYISIIIVALLFYSCEKPCYDSQDGPPFYRIAIVDSATNENVFANGTFLESQVEVTTPSSTSFDYYFDNADDTAKLIVISPANLEGTYTTNVKLSNEITIPIEAIIVKDKNRCYTNYLLTDVTVVGYESSYDAERNIITIKI